MILVDDYMTSPKSGGPRIPIEKEKKIVVPDSIPDKSPVLPNEEIKEEENEDDTTKEESKMLE